jgi:ubiquinone/menaquinone biosynthesis C-methylase UbiE
MYFFDRLKNFNTISYWKARAKKHGVKAVYNLSHTEEEMTEVTATQLREIFPVFQSQLNGTESIVLDFGCGPGRFTQHLAKAIKGKAIGVDPIQTLLDLAPNSPDVTYKKIHKNIIPLEESSVDIVWCCLVLGGIDDKNLVVSINEISRVLRPFGLLFLIENTAEKQNTQIWHFRSVKEYQAIFPFADLHHLYDYYDFDERISIIAGRRK